MRSLTLLACVLPLLSYTTAFRYDASNTPLWKRDYEGREYYALQLSEGMRPETVESEYDLRFEGPIGALEDHYLFSTSEYEPIERRDELHTLRKRRLEKRSTVEHDILWMERQKPGSKRLVKRSLPVEERQTFDLTGSPKERFEIVKHALGIQDPIFKDQWHILNTVQEGHDLNVTGVWAQGITGHNVTTAIVDDGLDFTSLDLADSYYAAGSYDFNAHSPDPLPKLSDDQHGTRCAGEIAATKNDVCGVGLAFDSKVAGLRILSAVISDADEAIAMNYDYQYNDIYSCSWGPPDDGQAMDAPGILIKRAMVNGVNRGRNGLGSIYVFATGNGAANGDNCNFDGYTNSIYSITVGAIDRKGLHPYYSEECSAQLVVTYSSGSGDYIHTTDIGTNKCTNHHGGTSAAAPLGAGVIALVLSVRPDLGWRDVQYLVVETAVPVNVDDEDWEVTGAGYWYNHKYGYGKLDAWAIVERAKEWEVVKPQAWHNISYVEVNEPIPNNQGAQGEAVRSVVTITKDDLKKSNLERVEHITVTVNIDHQRRGDISVDLVGPRGHVSKLAVARRNDNSAEGIRDWTFMTVKHWGESGVGDWTLIVRDEKNSQYSGKLLNWRMTLWGESVDPALAVPHPLPGTDDDHPLPPDPVLPSTTASATYSQSAHPRPVISITKAESGHAASVHSAQVSTVPHPKVKPTTTATATTTTTTGVAATATPVQEDEKVSDETTSATETATTGKTYEIMGNEYGLIVIVVVFVSVGTALLGAAIAAVYFFIRRQRLRAAQREDYEFKVLRNTGDADVDETPAEVKRGGVEGVLYDAFDARDSDEEIFDALGEVSDDDEEDEERRRLNRT
ncbi:hypothetical protein SAICODRAFT_58465 [Saitoella complicata NRRL Y-17804]|uniref:uncharacterized protein n=1 Tax=Saitoella complicata (strain BCRC 22490 / CBS 7301 / JCM 7358 / NBRC 10748 / NRRL Y-17804) TaxID=698492 RepID=UPI0008670046|nr:uncharacterized protein SAICODRAFT_58465 [Saitoella complicata NRRL Y-17804]ODQ52302.1 hypothetical protein SAICODRAFT_58465 [Saitoella complicata NRRL Y-17804]